MFEGFSPQTIDFMWGIRFNNEKSWFEAHKQEYLTYFYRPMQALSQEVYQRFALAHSDLDLIAKVSRIYRDARRLRGRGPYKDRLWCSIERPSECWTGDPVFWFELEPEGYSYGLGYYSAPPLTMAKFRARLDRDPKPMEKLARTFKGQGVFQLEGETYKRSKGETSPLLAPWYQKKNFTLVRNCPHDQLLFSHDLVDVLVEGYEFLLPFYRYFSTLPGDPDPTL
jgi:uncharacterized protein (TIGR02453 family)